MKMKVDPIYGKPLWKKFIQVKYGESIGNLVVEGGRKDIMPLEEVVGSNWCNDNIIRKVANDFQTNLGGRNATFHRVFYTFLNLKSKGR